MFTGKPVSLYACIAGLFYSLNNNVNAQDNIVEDSVPVFHPKLPSVSKPVKIFKAQPDTLVVVNPDDTSAVKLSTVKPAFIKARTVLDQQLTDNFLLAIPTKTFNEQFESKPVVKWVDTVKVHQPLKTVAHVSVEKVPSGFEGKFRAEASMGWLPFVIVGSLFLFAWVKLLYQKFLSQVIISLVDYQVSVRMFRERNVLFKNMSFTLFVVFSINTSIFILYFLQHFRVVFSTIQPFVLFIILNFALVLLYSVKATISRLLGHIFLVRDEFDEYVYNLNLFNKGVGMFLFPVVVAYPFIFERWQPYLLWFGAIVLGALFLLFLVRGFQIILRKEVSMFYLILYLCAVEILPVLLLVKLSGTLIGYV
jgi:hypothetical protein